MQELQLFYNEEQKYAEYLLSWLTIFIFDIFFAVDSGNGFNGINIKWINIIQKVAICKLFLIAIYSQQQFSFFFFNLFVIFLHKVHNMSPRQFFLSHAQIFEQVFRIEIISQSQQFPRSLQLILIFPQQHDKIDEGSNKILRLFFVIIAHMKLILQYQLFLNQIYLLLYCCQKYKKEKSQRPILQNISKANISYKVISFVTPILKCSRHAKILQPIIFIKLIFLVMDCENNNKPILIYFKTRGTAQLIRCVLLEAGVDFQQVFVNWNGYLEPEIIQKYNIDIKSLPYLIHNGLAIYGLFPIVKYCCSKFKRTDLLGLNLDDSIHIAEIMVKYTRQRGLILHTLFRGLKEIHEKNLGEKGKAALSKRLLEMQQVKRNLQPIRLMFQKTGQFLCGYLTILDFIFYDHCFYVANFHPSTQLDKCPEFQYVGQYKQFFESTEFFQKYGEKLSQYKVFFPEVDATVNDLIKSMWVGDPKYITCN